MNSLTNFIKFADIYGQRVQMNFSKQPIYKTVYGGLITLIIGGCFIAGCYFFGCILFNRLNPSVITSERSVTSAARINITESNIVAMFGVSNGASQIWSDPTIFRVYAVQQIMQITNSTDSGLQLRQLISYNKTMKTCDETDIGISEVKPYFNELNLTNLYCFEQGQDIFMEGDFDAQRFAQVFVYVEKCSNGTVPNVVCKPIDVINQKLQLSKIQMYLSNTIVDPLNFEEPFSSKGMNLYTQTSSNFPKEVQLYFTNQYIQDDVGFMFSQVEEKHSFVYTIQQETTFFSNYNVLVRVLMRLQKQKENLMQRRYQKFQDVVAQIGGLMKLLTTIGSIITYRFTQLYLFKAIGDEILIYDDANIQKTKMEKNNTSKSKKKKNSDIKYKVNSSQENVDKIKSPTSNKSQETNNQKNNNQEGQQQLDGFTSKIYNLEQKKSKFEKTASFELSNSPKNQLEKSKFQLTIIQSQKFFKVIQNSIQYNFIDYFKQLFAKVLQTNDFRAKLVQKGMQIIEQQLDIVYVINKLNEIDKLKTVIFNRDQLKIFDCIPKPIISDDYLFSDQLNISPPKNQNRERQDSVQSTQMPHGKDNMVYYNIQKAKSEEQKIQDAIYGLQNILNSQQLTKIDKKLLQIIDPKLLQNYQPDKYNVAQDQNRLENSSRYQDDSVFESHNHVLQKLNNSNQMANEQLKIKKYLSESLSRFSPVSQQAKNISIQQDSKIIQPSQFIQDSIKQSSVFSDDQSIKLNCESRIDEQINCLDIESSERRHLNVNASQYNPYLQIQATTLESIAQKSKRTKKIKKPDNTNK
ncbi:transmembrane protein, putative (macronuclear) [Tetrahymena thermophila SB210]|uniref:Transmembrane protein, putative n=1 Tax=Tetrahymena thermophila (strain SB210) TaxID=312017 RepID=Q22YA5_TETTS|nr:transmembrane protein, putative [Tetrahymena thermophila SB210]EAR90119.2 transmembrane protein, putative [Tetrahymena thermophila SB210]|eukprot:XP_001010364.2 transmembrane protein, putative [Tetrahymena thermophila SB210]